MSLPLYPCSPTIIAPLNQLLPPAKGSHSSTFHISLTRFWSPSHCNSSTYLMKGAYVEPTSAQVDE